MKTLLFTLILSLVVLNSYSQNNIGINTATPDPSAALDITATDMGLLIPRMTTSERINISSPANGLMVFDTDTRSFWFYDGNATTWKNFSSAGSNYSIYDSDGDTFISVEENPDDDTPRIYIAGTEKFRFGTMGIEVLNTGNSVYIGEGAGNNDNLNEHGNVGIGTAVLENSTNRNALVAVGDSALFNNGIGSSNNYHGTKNSAIGSKSLFSNTTGYRNTAVGYYSMYLNTEGQRNFAGGASALYSNQTGNNNTATGNNAAYSNTSGKRNTATGSQALYSSTTGNNNTVNGYKALYSNTSGYSNVAIGINSLHNNTDRSNLIAIGDSALFNNGTGTTSPDEAIENTAVGSKSLFSNTTGYGNTATGYQALYSNTSGSENSAFGYMALYLNNNTGYNTAIGSLALMGNTSGSQNFAGGYKSLVGNISGTYNTAVGSNSLKINSSGDQNTAIGYKSLENNTTGSHNTAVGSDAGPISGSPSLSNTGAFGYQAKTTATNEIRIGNSSIMSIGGFQDWTNVSDKKFNKNIEENVVGLDFIMKLRPVTYNLDIEKIDDFLSIPDSLRSDEIQKKAALDKEAIIQTGFLAEEVEQAAQSLGYDFSGVDAPKNEHDFYGLRYAEFVVPLVKAVQEQQELIERLSNIVEKQNARINELKSKIDSLDDPK